MARAAFSLATGATAVEMREVTFLGPLLVVHGDRREARVLLQREGEGAAFRIVSRSGDAGGSQDHARGRILPLAGHPGRRDPADVARRIEDGRRPSRCRRPPTAAW